MEYGLIYPELSHTWLFAWSKLTSQLGRHMAALDEFFSFCLHHGEENGVTYIGGEHKGKWRKNSKLHIILQEQSPGPNLDQPHTDLEVWETAPLKKIHIKNEGKQGRMCTTEEKTLRLDKFSRPTLKLQASS